ncbi:MAG: hypothetical protein ISP83_04520 [Candidatus Poseidonia sp.]|nr:hypothetical protein [Poseidonia sp.]MBL6806972.1 hypothetical protein [Poseidonia sp.]MBL6886891.1 hypothetical protein [Poseidonia sp.]MBL6893162.1 hypothetical protein [Poseidonia sp.]
MVMTGRIYVPSAVEENGAVVGMGCFSTQETAMNVLRSFLKKSHQVPLERASIASWEVDVVGDDAVTMLSEFECRVCPVCHRTTFWIDIARFKAMCYGSACAAWIEESSVEADVINCGWPPTQFSEQVETIDDAMRSLRRIAAQAEAAGLSALDSNIQIDP